MKIDIQVRDKNGKVVKTIKRNQVLVKGYGKSGYIAPLFCKYKNKEYEIFCDQIKRTYTFYIVVK